MFLGRAPSRRNTAFEESDVQGLLSELYQRTMIYVPSYS